MTCSTTTPTTEPTQITQGERVEWTREYCAYPATLWTLQYRFRGPSTGFNIAATADGSTFEAALTPTQTAAMAVGKWKWDAYVTEIADGTNIEHACGAYIQVYAGAAVNDFAIVDNRTPAEIQLAAIDAALLADNGNIVEYEKSTPAGSVRVKKNREELMKLRTYWASIVSREKLAASGKIIQTSRVRMPGC